jgi:acetamidase/formamidase
MRLGRSIHVSADNTKVGLSHEFQPVASVRPHSEIGIELRDASGGQISESSTVRDVEAVDIAKTNPATGPIYVEGAKSGDVLQVELLAIEPANWGFTVQAPGMGLLPDQFDKHWLHIWSLKGSQADFVEGVSVPLHPFCGFMSVAPAEPGIHWDAPRRIGGNMDLKYVTAGSSIFFPIEVDGALFSIGDPHAAQGDGEVCGSAIECAATATIRLSVRRDVRIDSPEVDVPRSTGPHRTGELGYHVTTGIATDLMTAARHSIERMIIHLEDMYGLDPPHAYALCSVAVDLRISEIVNQPNWIVAAVLPKALFTAPG